MISMESTASPAVFSENYNDEHADERHRKKLNITYDTYDSIYYGLYFMGRYLVVFLSYFLCMIACLYGTGSLVTLEATNFFCPSYTLEEIHEYNFENGNKHGDNGDSCRRVDRQGLDSNVLSDLNNNIFIGKIDNESLDFLSYFEALLYFSIAFILFIAALYQTYLLIYDTFIAIHSILYQEERNNRVYRKLCQLQKQMQSSKTKKSLVEKSPNPNLNKQKNSKKSNVLCCCILLWKSYIFCVGNCMKCYFKHVEPVYYVDSKLRMLSIIAREWLEITTQIYALLLYGGINVFALESNVLSQKAYIIQSFCVIISMNCITGMTGHVRDQAKTVVVFLYTFAICACFIDKCGCFLLFL